MSKYKIRAKNRLTTRRVYVVGILIFLENFLMPISGILGTEQWPTPVQLASCLVTASLQVVTVFMALLKVEKEE